MERNIEKLIADKKTLGERVHERISVELQRQKDGGKKFISDEEIDNLIDEIITDEIKNNNR
jgi:hypothetical protein